MKLLYAGLDEYIARVIETYLQAFVEILNTDKLVLPVNYNEGAIAIVNKIAAFAGITISENEMSAMRQRSIFHGKYPEQVFAEAQIHESVPAYLNRCFVLYNELEKVTTVATTVK